MHKNYVLVIMNFIIILDEALKVSANIENYNRLII